MNTKVTVWTKPSCVQCHATIRRMRWRGIKFMEENILTRPDKIDEFRAAGFLQTPVVEATIDQKTDRWAGFRPDLIDQFAEEMRPA